MRAGSAGGIGSAFYQYRQRTSGVFMAVKVMDNATREKLLGMMPFSPTSTIDFSPPYYEAAGIPADLRPIFTCRSLTVEEADKWRNLLSEIGRHATAQAATDEDAAISKGIVDKKQKEWMSLALSCVTKISNVVDPATAECFDLTDPVQIENVWTRLPAKITGEICHYIGKISCLYGLPEIEKKSFESSPPSPSE